MDAGFGYWFVMSLVLTLIAIARLRDGLRDWPSIIAAYMMLAITVTETQ